MGKKVSDFAALSLLVLFLASFVFWGCSGNNPAGNLSPSLKVDAGTGNGGSFGTNDDTIDDSDFDNNYPPDLPDTEGDILDPAQAEHLQIDNSKNILLENAASMIDIKGGVVSLEIDGRSIDFYFQPFSVYAETNINLVVQKGKNAWNEDLYMFYFGPIGLEFSHYPILEMQVAPYFNDRPGSTYELYCMTDGSWSSYYSCASNPQGLLKFFIPHLSTYALLITNPAITDIADSK